MKWIHDELFECGNRLIFTRGCNWISHLPIALLLLPHVDRVASFLEPGRAGLEGKGPRWSIIEYLHFNDVTWWNGDVVEINLSFVQIEHRKGKWWVELASLDWSGFICLKIEFPNQALPPVIESKSAAWLLAPSQPLFLCWLTWSHELTSKATSCKMESLAYFFSLVSFRCNTWKKLRTSRTGLAYQPGFFPVCWASYWGLGFVVSQQTYKKHQKTWIVTTEQFRGAQKFIQYI